MGQTRAIARARYRSVWASPGGSAPADDLHVRIATTQLNKPFGGFAGDQSFQSQAHKMSFFVHPGELCRPLHELVVDIQHRSHMHEFASIRHRDQVTPGSVVRLHRSGLGSDGRRAAYLGVLDSVVALQYLKRPQDSFHHGNSIAGSSRTTKQAGPPQAAQCVIARSAPCIPCCGYRLVALL